MKEALATFGLCVEYRMLNSSFLCFHHLLPYGSELLIIFCPIGYPLARSVYAHCHQHQINEHTSVIASLGTQKLY